MGIQKLQSSNEPISLVSGTSEDLEDLAFYEYGWKWYQCMYVIGEGSLLSMSPATTEILLAQRL